MVALQAGRSLVPVGLQTKADIFLYPGPEKYIKKFYFSNSKSLVSA
jgi:hypothetical protein